MLFPVEIRQWATRHHVGQDVLTAQTLRRAETEALCARVLESL